MKQKRWIFFISILLTAIFAAPSWAAIEELPLPDVSNARFKKAVKRARKLAKRKVANKEVVNDAQATSIRFRNIRNSFIGGEYVEILDDKSTKKSKKNGATTSQDIHVLLAKIQKGLDAYDKWKRVGEKGDVEHNEYKEDQRARFLANQLSLAIPFRGFVHRARDIFDTKEGDAKAAHAAAVTALRTAASGIMTYLPTDQWPAMFQYSVEPYYVPPKGKRANESHRKACLKNWHPRCDIHDGQTFQMWMVHEFLPQIHRARVRLAEMDFWREPVYWDNQILYGTANFTSNRDRFLRLGEAERLALLAGYDATISTIYGLNAFHLDGFFEAFDSVAKVYGFSTAFNTFSATSMDRFRAIRKHENLFRLKQSGKDPAIKEKALSDLKRSYVFLKAALQASFESWQVLDGRENDRDLQNNLFDPRAVAPFNRIFNTGWQNAFAVVGMTQSYEEAQNLEVTSAVVNGEKLIVNLKEFYMNPPDSLQDFMPEGNGILHGQGPGGELKFKKKALPFIQIGSTPRFLLKELKDSKGNVQQVEYRDYYRGAPNKWKYHVYKKYFPGIRSEKDVRRLNRVLSQSWGTFFLGIPLAMVVL